MCELNFGEQTITISPDKRRKSVRMRADDGSYGVRIDMDIKNLQRLIEALQKALNDVEKEDE